MSYKLFSDSSCDTPIELLTKHNITTVPFYVSFDQQNYFKEIEELSIQSFYDTLLGKNVFPKTSLPSVEDYMNKFTPALKDGEDILCICLTSKFSGSYQSAVNARAILLEDYPNAKIEILDSIQATCGQGLVLLQAAYMKEAGYSLEDNVAKLNELKKTARIMFTVDTLEYLTKGGRIGKVKSLAGTMLNLKPMIQLKDGELVPYSNIRGRKKSLEKVIAMVKEYFDENNENYSDYEFAVVQSTTLDDAQATKLRAQEETGQTIDLPFFQVGVTIGTNTGPGALGVCFIKKFDCI